MTWWIILGLVLNMTLGLFILACTLAIFAMQNKIHESQRDILRLLRVRDS